MEANYQRLARLIEQAVKRLALDLTGLNVLTEAGSGYFSTTPIIAAVAGAAHVTAVTKTSAYGNFEEIRAQVISLSELMGVTDRIEITTRDQLQSLESIDILTNLGHLRPLNADFLARFDPSRVVIPYMCEAWEVREGDVDLAYCKQHGIPVAGTNESDPNVDCFATCGVIAAKLLLERDFEIRGGNYAILSSDSFGRVIADFLRQSGARAFIVENLTGANLALLQNADALVVADYTSSGTLIGPQAVSASAIRAVNSSLEIIQVAGEIDTIMCKQSGIHVHPPERLTPKRMSRTLAYAGPKPIIDLHAAGLKVGAILSKRETDSLLQPM